MSQIPPYRPEPEQYAATTTRRRVVDHRCGPNSSPEDCPRDEGGRFSSRASSAPAALKGLNLARLRSEFGVASTNGPEFDPEYREEIIEEFDRRLDSAGVSYTLLPGSLTTDQHLRRATELLEEAGSAAEPEAGKAPEQEISQQPGVQQSLTERHLAVKEQAHDQDWNAAIYESYETQVLQWQRKVLVSYDWEKEQRDLIRDWASSEAWETTEDGRYKMWINKHLLGEEVDENGYPVLTNDQQIADSPQQRSDFTPVYLRWDQIAVESSGTEVDVKMIATTTVGEDILSPWSVALNETTEDQINALAEASYRSDEAAAASDVAGQAEAGPNIAGQLSDFSAGDLESAYRSSGATSQMLAGLEDDLDRRLKEEGLPPINRTAGNDQVNFSDGIERLVDGIALRRRGERNRAEAGPAGPAPVDQTLSLSAIKEDLIGSRRVLDDLSPVSDTPEQRSYIEQHITDLEAEIERRQPPEQPSDENTDKRYGDMKIDELPASLIPENAPPGFFENSMYSGWTAGQVRHEVDRIRAQQQDIPEHGVTWTDLERMRQHGTDMLTAFGRHGEQLLSDAIDSGDYTKVMTPFLLDAIEDGRVEDEYELRRNVQRDIEQQLQSIQEAFKEAPGTAPRFQRQTAAEFAQIAETAEEAITSYEDEPWRQQLIGQVARSARAGQEMLERGVGSPTVSPLQSKTAEELLNIRTDQGSPDTPYREEQIRQVEEEVSRRLEEADISLAEDADGRVLSGADQALRLHDAVSSGMMQDPEGSGAELTEAQQDHVAELERLNQQRQTTERREAIDRGQRALDEADGAAFDEGREYVSNWTQFVDRTDLSDSDASHYKESAQRLIAVGNLKAQDRVSDTSKTNELSSDQRILMEQTLNRESNDWRNALEDSPDGELGLGGTEPDRIGTGITMRTSLEGWGSITAMPDGRFEMYYQVAADSASDSAHHRTGGNLFANEGDAEEHLASRRAAGRPLEGFHVARVFVRPDQVLTNANADENQAGSYYKINADINTRPYTMLRNPNTGLQGTEIARWGLEQANQARATADLDSERNIPPSEEGPRTRLPSAEEQGQNRELENNFEDAVHQVLTPPRDDNEHERANYRDFVESTVDEAIDEAEWHVDSSEGTRERRDALRGNLRDEIEAMSDSLGPDGRGGATLDEAGFVLNDDMGANRFRGYVVLPRNYDGLLPKDAEGEISNYLDSSAAQRIDPSRIAETMSQPAGTQTSAYNGRFYATRDEAQTARSEAVGIGVSNELLVDENGNHTDEIVPLYLRPDQVASTRAGGSDGRLRVKVNGDVNVDRASVARSRTLSDLNSRIRSNGAHDSGSDPSPSERERQAKTKEQREAEISSTRKEGREAKAKRLREQIRHTPTPTAKESSASVYFGGSTDGGSFDSDDSAFLESLNIENADAGSAGSDIATLVGAANDTEVTWDIDYGDSLSVSVNGEGYKASRTIGIESDGTKYISNDSFFVDKAYQGQGVGTKQLGRQVQWAQRWGFDEIHVSAIGSGSGGTHSGGELKSSAGYYVWAKFGFNASVKDATAKKAAKDGFNRPDDIHSLLLQPGGIDWWKENGHGFTGKFDLSPGSTSYKIFSEYLRRKVAEGSLAERFQKERAEQKPRMRGYEGEELDFTEEDLALLDEIWQDLMDGKLEDKPRMRTKEEYAKAHCGPDSSPSDCPRDEGGQFSSKEGGESPEPNAATLALRAMSSRRERGEKHKALETETNEALKKAGLKDYSDDPLEVGSYLDTEFEFHFYDQDLETRVSLLDAAENHSGDVNLIGFEIEGNHITKNDHLHRFAKSMLDEGYGLDGKELEAGQPIGIEYAGELGYFEPEGEPDLSEFVYNMFKGEYGEDMEGGGYDNWGTAGFVTADGRVVNMGVGGTRAEDHRGALPTEEAMKRWNWPKEAIKSRSQALLELGMRSGNARIHVNGPSISIETYASLTGAQERKIAEFFEDWEHRGESVEVVLDINDEHGIFKAQSFSSASFRQITSVIDDAYAYGREREEEAETIWEEDEDESEDYSRPRMYTREEYAKSHCGPEATPTDCPRDEGGKFSSSQGGGTEVSDEQAAAWEEQDAELDADISRHGNKTMTEGILSRASTITDVSYTPDEIGWDEFNHDDRAALKTATATAIHDRLKGNEAFGKLIEKWSESMTCTSEGCQFGLEWARGKHNLPEDSTPEETAVSLLIGAWAQSSSDHSMLSLELQKAAALEFGLENSHKLEEALDEVIRESARAGRYVGAGDVSHTESATGKFGEFSAYRAFLRAMYDNTQESLADMGLKPDDTVTVYRGMRFRTRWGQETSADSAFAMPPELAIMKANAEAIPEAPGEGYEEFGYTTTLPSPLDDYVPMRVSHKQNPMSSFALHDDVAGGFSNAFDQKLLVDGIEAVTLKTQVKVKDILSTPVSGFGCASESEVVVLSGDRPNTEVSVRWYDEESKQFMRAEQAVGQKAERNRHAYHTRHFPDYQFED